MKDNNPTSLTIARRWRHRTRGTIYEEVGRAELQAADRNRPHPTEQDTLVIYRGDVDDSDDVGSPGGLKKNPAKAARDAAD